MMMIDAAMAPGTSSMMARSSRKTVTTIII